MSAVFLFCFLFFFFFKQKTAYELRISDWSSDVCSSDLLDAGEYDAIVLACAGLLRLGFDARIRTRLDAPEWLPAPAQGAIAIESRDEIGRASCRERVCQYV